MEINKEKTIQYWNEGINFLKEKEYEKAIIAFEKAQNTGFRNEYGMSETTTDLANLNSSKVSLNWTIILFYKAMAHILCDNKVSGIALLKELIYRHTKVKLSKVGVGTQRIDVKDNIFNKFKLENSGFVELDLDISGGLGNILTKEIIEWWQKSNEILLPKIGKTQNTKSANLSTDNNIFSTKLNELVGLNAVKQEVETLIGVVKIRQLRKERGQNITPQTLHMVFKGNPGTGKTTVARILADIFKEIGLLSKGHLIETDRAGIVEKFVGHTAKKMQELVESAKGGILFIDEAYSLARDDSDKDFGREAIDTLVKLMEDYRDDLVVIVAGYPDEMEKFLSSNSGLKSRFSQNIDFEDYNIEELTEVFKRMCNSKGYIFTENILSKVKVLIATTKAKDDTTFGNARGVRNIFERIEKNQSSRLYKIKDYISNEDLQTILEEDSY